MFTHAIVRPPASNFAAGLTTAGRGAPDYELALKQHDAYCAALVRCGLTLIKLAKDPDYPDSTFVEDVAVLISGSGAAHERCAIITRPGASSRLGEVESIRGALTGFPNVFEIESPGTLDGGDICQAADHFFIGISERTNEPGAAQLATFLAQAGYSSSLIDIRQTSATRSVPGAVATGSLLHVKSGLAYMGDNRLAVATGLSQRPEFHGYDLVSVTAAETYAANCVRINDCVLVAAGFPHFQDSLNAVGYKTIALDMSEFQKMDGGLSCLSLRF